MKNVLIRMINLYVTLY